MVRSIVGMTHRGLCRSRCHPALAQQRAEGVAKGMNVNRSAASSPCPSPFGHYPRQAGQVTVKDSHQPGRHGEQRRIGRQRRHGSQRQTRLPLWPRRIALVAFLPFLVFRVESNGRRFSGGFLQSRCLVGKPSSKIGGKIGPKRYRRSFAVLFVGGVRAPGRAWRRRAHLPHGNRSQLAFAKPGQHQRLVDQGPFLPEPFQAAALYFRRSLPTASPFRLPRRTVMRSNSGRRRATSKSRINSASVSARRFRRRSAFASAFGTLAKGLPRRAGRLSMHQLQKATKAARYSLRVRGPHAFCLLRHKPAFQGGRVQVGRADESRNRRQAGAVALRYRCHPAVKRPSPSGGQ